MEGLACHFERKVNGGIIPSLFELIKDRDWRPFYTEMKDKLTSLDYNFDAYFWEAMKAVGRSTWGIGWGIT